MRFLQSRALILGALLAAGALVTVLASRHPERGERVQNPLVALPRALPSVSSEPPLPLPTIEAEPTVDAQLIPTFRMPFPAGVVVLCSQGNSSEPGRTHALPQNLHALDFSNRALAEVPVVAAAVGTVAYLVEHSPSDDDDAGGGYGNQVRLLHQHGVFSLYAHLDRVLVRVGQRVARGQQLGTMGRTGLAGDRHLHFSIHHGAIGGEGVPNTLAIPALVTRELDGPQAFQARASGDFRCSSARNPWSGALYASDNEAPGVFTRSAQEAEAALRQSVARRAQLWDFSKRVPNVTSSEYERFLQPLIAEAQADPVTQYTWAVEVELPARRFHAASRHLDLAEKYARYPALFEPWLAGWIAAQRGTIALMQSRPAAAERYFAQAHEQLPIVEIDAYIRQQRERFAAP